MQLGGRCDEHVTLKREISIKIKKKTPVLFCENDRTDSSHKYTKGKLLFSTKSIKVLGKNDSQDLKHYKFEKQCCKKT